MTEEEIVSLYFSRDPKAIEETQALCGSVLHAIAFRFTNDSRDAEECVNDTYLEAWNRIPPLRPLCLPAFLSKIVRTKAIKVWKKQNAAKRKGSVLPLAEELEEILPDPSADPEGEYDAARLSECLNRFLETLSSEARFFFLRRYFFGDPIPSIALTAGVSESKVTASLHRTRKKLKQKLIQEDFTHDV